MKRFAVVPTSGGIVSNVVVGEDAATVSAVVGECVEETKTTGPADTGSAWNGSVFIPRPSPDHIWDGTSWIVPDPDPAE